jgi:hypothetical protein
LTARRPDPGLLDLCRRHGVAVVRASRTRGWPGHSGRPVGTARHADCGWVDVRVADGRTARLRAPVDHPALAIIVRPDPVIADVVTRSRLPRLPWSTRD